MLFVIHAVDKPEQVSVRNEHYAGHRAHLDSAPGFGVEIKLAGPFTADDGVTPIGSLLVVEAAERAAVERFSAADPFAKAGIWQAVLIAPLRARRGTWLPAGA